MLTNKCGTPGRTAIGPVSWRNDTLKQIKLTKEIAKRSDRACEMGRKIDPLPNFREIILELSNNDAHRYFREVRAVCGKLRESMAYTNNEIKSLSNAKDALERLIEHTRKDLRMNSGNQSSRLNRPSREMKKDGADDLLEAEQMHLKNLKQTMEVQLQTVQGELQALAAVREKLASVYQERLRVLDLTCQSYAVLEGCQSSASTPARPAAGVPPGSLRQRPTPGSARRPCQGSDPLGAFTPEVERALSEAREAQQRSSHLRCSTAEAVACAQQLQRAVHENVNRGLVQKIAETNALKQHLNITKGYNRAALHRSQLWYDRSHLAWERNKGPVASTDYATSEKFTRPIVKMLQRHPGADLPEVEELSKGGHALLESMHNTSNNIGMMRTMESKLDNDVREKRISAKVDGNVVRDRRRKADHRWAMGGAFAGW